jgi:uncharacterized cupredoxin-like copper-binding protein
MIVFRRAYSCLLLMSVSAVVPCMWEANAVSRSIFEAASEAKFEIIAKKRSFTPAILALPLKKPVTLVIMNDDAELHAFVPLLLFEGSHVMVTGNSAPEFNESGFARVLIPPDGKAEIRFVPQRAGTFFYICDLPGHNMRGEIVVQDDAMSRRSPVDRPE